jgi:hypothetical protein
MEKINAQSFNQRPYQEKASRQLHHFLSDYLFQNLRDTYDSHQDKIPTA